MVELSGDLTEAFPQFLRAKAIEEIDTRNITRDELAEKLDLFPAGVDRVLNNTQWPASLGLRVLDALDVSVDVTFSEPSNS